MTKTRKKLKELKSKIQLDIIYGKISSYNELMCEINKNNLLLHRNGENYISFSFDDGTDIRYRVYFEFENTTKDKNELCQTGAGRLARLKEAKRRQLNSDGCYIYCLYALTSPTPTCYIGQTININERMKSHFNVYMETKNNLHNIIRCGDRIMGSANLFVSALLENKTIMVSVLDKISRKDGMEHNYKLYIDMESRWFTSAYLSGWKAPGALQDHLRKHGWGNLNKNINIIPPWDAESIINRGVDLLLNEQINDIIDLSPRSNLELFENIKQHNLTVRQ